MASNMNIIPIEDTNQNQWQSSGTEPYPKIDIKLEADETIKMEPSELVYNKTENASAGVKVKIEGEDLSEIYVKSENDIKYENIDIDTELGDYKFLDYKPLVSECHVETDIKNIKLENEEVVIKHMDDDEIDQNTFEIGHRKQSMISHEEIKEIEKYIAHRNQSQVKIHKCHVCSYQSKHKSHFLRHLLVHIDPSERKMEHKNQSQVKMFKCCKCSYQSQYKSHLHRHILLHKDSSEMKMFKCEHCNYECKDTSNYRRHLRIHEKPSPLKMLQCHECSYQSNNKKNLQRHLHMHKNPSKGEKYKCFECGYQSKYKNHLQRHLLVHKDRSGANNF